LSTEDAECSSAILLRVPHFDIHCTVRAYQKLAEHTQAHRSLLTRWGCSWL